MMKLFWLLAPISLVACGEVGEIWKKKGFSNEPSSVFRVNAQRLCEVEFKDLDANRELNLSVQCEDLTSMLLDSQPRCQAKDFKPTLARFPGKQKPVVLCQRSVFKDLRTKSSLRVVVIGDAGAGQSFYQGYQQKAVARQAQLSCERMGGCDFGLYLGDNFYPNGVDSVWDPKFEGYFEETYRGFQNMPFYAVLGNHDYHGNIIAQLEYTYFSQRWRMPNLYYGIQGLPEWARFFAIDTQAFIGSDDAKVIVDSQIASLCSYFSDEKGWKFVFGHFPPISTGKYGGTQLIAPKLASIYDRCSFDLYLSGHEHSQEFIETTLYSVLIQGGGGAGLRDIRPKLGLQKSSREKYGFNSWESKFAESSHGYTILELTPKELHTYFFRVRSDEGLRFREEDAEPSRAAYRCKREIEKNGCKPF